MARLAETELLCLSDGPAFHCVLNVDKAKTAPDGTGAAPCIFCGCFNSEAAADDDGNPIIYDSKDADRHVRDALGEGS